MLFARQPVQAQQAVIDSLQRIIRLNRKDTVEAKALEMLATELIRKDIGQAKLTAHQSIALARRLRYTLCIGGNLTQLTITCSKLGQTDSAHYYLTLLKEFAEEHPLPATVANYNFTAGLIYKNEGKFREALPFMIKSLAVLRSMKNSKVSVAGQLLNIGNAYFSLGDYKNAVSFHLESLRMFEELKNDRGESFTNQSIGNDFVMLGRPTEGLPYLEKALRQKEALKDSRGMASAWTGLGMLHKKAGRYDRAVYYYLKAAKTEEEFKLTAELAQTNFELGSLYRLKKQYPEAEPYLKQSKLLARQMGDSALSKAIDAERTVSRSSSDQQESLEKDLLASLASSVESGRKLTELSSYEHLIRYYTTQKNFERAFYFQNKLQHVKDSADGLQIQLQIQHLQEQFKAKEKEKEIALLRKDQQLQAAELKRQKTIQYFIMASVALFIVIAFLVINRFLVLQRGRRLIEIERVRNSIARDLHDDIGSTLSSINILSRLALGHPMEETLRTRFNKIEDHSRKMMDMMSDIVWSINPVNDTADKTVIRMKEFAAEILEPKNIRYHFEESGMMSGARMNVNQRKNLFLIFKESMNNAAKYSQCTDIAIGLTLSQHTFQMLIRDNGLGFNRGAIRRGNGLANIEARAALMGSSVRIESEPGKGTLIAVSTVIT